METAGEVSNQEKHGSEPEDSKNIGVKNNIGIPGYAKNGRNWIHGKQEIGEFDED